MLAHALTIVINELNAHLAESYKTDPPSDLAGALLGNVAEGFTSGSGTNGVTREGLYFSVVNIKEEKTLKNIQHYVRNEITLKTTYENPSIFLNFLVLVTATHTSYSNALTMLSRVIRFFQCKNVFTEDNVAQQSITDSSPVNPLDKLETFKLIFDLYSPTMEEVNHLWGTLGGKQYPFVLYTLRMLDLKFAAVPSERPLIAKVVSNILHKKP